MESGNASDAAGAIPISETSKIRSRSSSLRVEIEETNDGPSQMAAGPFEWPWAAGIRQGQNPQVEEVREAEGSLQNIPQINKVDEAADSSHSPNTPHILMERIAKPNKAEVDSDVSEAIKVPDAVKSQVEEGAASTEGFEFEMHYDLQRPILGNVVYEILSDLSTYKHIHNWDEKLFTGPLKAILKVVHRAWGENGCTQASLMAHSTVEEVEYISSIGAKIAPPTTKDPGDATNYLLFKKRTSSKGDGPLATSNGASRGAADGAKDKASSIEGASALSPAQGRIIYIKDRISYLERITILFVYLFCIRLQDEDYGFARAFIERHLSLKCGLKIPYHWQEKSPPEMDSSRQKCYKRVTVSCHITYLTLSVPDSKETTEDQLDRVRIFPFHHRKPPAESDEMFLLKASSSVLLTLCTPEESKSCEEEVCLLQAPRALWTVLVISCSPDFASEYQNRESLTPIAQYVRGITSTMYTQRVNAESIYEDMKNWFKSCNLESIFDDEKFTKSTSYHWAVRTCDELNESIASTLKFIQRKLENQVDKLCREAHTYEKIGVEHWLQQMKEEIFALEDLQSQILALREQVQESRNALHGVTSILQARTALQQGERTKTLAYLATVYLPLTATSSLYSMSVFPESATFISFFVVFVVLFLCTILLMLLGFNLNNVAERFKTRTIIPKKFSLLEYIRFYLTLLNPYNKPKKLGYDFFYTLPEFDFWPYLLARELINGLPIIILRSLVLPEICMPIDQYILYQNRNNPYVHIYYHWVWFIKDVIRAVLIPAWIGVAVGIVGYLLILDILYGCWLLIVALVEVVRLLVSSTG